jgi:hypothetical protein
LCAIRTATSWAWFDESPPVTRGQDVAAVGLGDGAAVTEGRTVAVGDAAEGAGDREADGEGEVVVGACVCGWAPHALTITIPSVRSRAP